jgi:hypothetical protein
MSPVYSDYELEVMAFVIAWQTSPTASVAATRLGTSPSAVRSRANRLRKMGVHLKSMARQRQAA